MSDALRVILQKPKPFLWGGDFGANERGVAISLSWTDGEQEAKDSDSLLSTDIVRYVTKYVYINLFAWYTYMYMYVYVCCLYMYVYVSIL